MKKQTSDFRLVDLSILHPGRRGLSIERIGRIWIGEKLRQEDLKYVDHVIHWRPCLVDDVQADGTGSDKRIDFE